ncbi:MAG: methyltransferase domain-containing protein [Acetobacteraceae bacterium]|nr:methyltransferase domain-containing protein [Acetobacteraceae bacterium]
MASRESIGAPNPVARDYDALAPEYARRLAGELDGKPFDRAWLSAFARRMRGAGLVGDVGCGPGHVSAFLAAEGAEVLGLDLSAGMVAEARRAYPALCFAQADLLRLGETPGRFAGLLAMYALIHFDDAVLAAALGACHAALRPGGDMLAAVHLGEGTLHPPEMWGIPVTLGFRLFAEGELEARLTAAGFAVRESVVRAPYPGVEYPSRRLYLRARRRDG